MKKIFIPFLFSISLVINAQAPANDDCSNAQAVVIPSSGSICFNSSNANATSDNTINACDVGGAGNEIWFTYIVSGANNTITVTPNGSIPASDMVVTIISTGCNAGTYETCGSATGAGAATTSTGLVPGTQAWISIETNGTDGDFEVCITSIPPDPTPGNTCSQATVLCDKTSFTVSSLAGFSSSGVRPSCFGAAVKKDVWFQFTVGVTGTLEWTATGLVPTEFDWAVFDITDGCVGSGATQVACNYSYANGVTNCAQVAEPFGMIPGGTGEMSVPITVTAGRTYAIVIDNFCANNTGFNFEWGNGTFELYPSSNFTVSPTSSCSVPLIVNISNTSAADSYSWNFGDGSTSTTSSTSFTHTYTATGDYLISLVSTAANGCANVASQRVNLNAGPVIAINPSAPSICAGNSVNLTATIALGTPYNDRAFNANPNATITNNSTTGINSNITSSGMVNTTLSAAVLQSICFTINHSSHDDIGRGPTPDAVQITVNGNTYNFTPLPLPNATGTATYCFPASVITAINAAGGNSNTTWTFHIEDNRGGGGGTGSLVSWEVILRDVNAVTGYTWLPITNLTNNTTLTPTASPTTTTTYTLTANDLFGCQSSKTVTVTVNPKPTAQITTGNTTICSGSSTNISIALTGSQPWSITYTLNGGSPTTVNGITSSPYTFSTSTGGVYAITNVSDATGCSGTINGTSETVTVNTPIIISNIVATCGAGNYVVTFDMTGGNPGTYSVTGMNGGTITGSGPYTYTSNAISSATTNYSFTIGDGICANQTVNGTKNCSCAVDAVLSGGGTVCAGTSAPNVVFTLTGGTSSPYTLTYAINGVPQTPVVASAGFPNSSYTITSPGAGTYSIVSISDGSCPGSGSGGATVTFNALPTATIGGTDTICSGDITSIDVALTGTSPWSITYTVNGGSSTVVSSINSTPYQISTGSAGIYAITSVSDLNCSNVGTGQDTIVVNALPTAILSGGGVACQGSTVNDTIIFTGAQPWTFIYNNGSTNDTIFNITSSPLIIANTGSHGIYTALEVLDKNCTNSASGNSTVVINSIPDASFTGFTNSSYCLAQLPVVLDPTVSGGVFSGTGMTDSTFNAGIGGPYTIRYDITVNGCSNFSEQTVSVTALDDATFTLADFCEGNPTTANITGVSGGTFIISPTTNGETIDINGVISNALGGTTYTVTYTTPAGACQNSSNINVQVFATPAITGNTTVCVNATSQLTGGGTPDGTTPWGSSNTAVATIDNAGLVTGITNGTSTITYLDANGCSNTTTVTVNPLPAMSISGGGFVCAGSSTASVPVSISFGGTSGPWIFTYNDGTTTITDTTNVNPFVIANPVFGTYTLIGVTDTITKCVNTASGSVFVSPSPNPNVTNGVANDPTCGQANGSITGIVVSGSSPYTYTWTDLNGNVISGPTTTTSTTPDLFNLPGGTSYILTVADANGCDSVLAPIAVDTSLAVVASFVADPTSGLIPLVVTFTNNSVNANPALYQWYFGTTDSANTVNATYTYDLVGSYTVMLIATDGALCSDTAYVTIVTSEESLLLIPNIITPNGDGSNELFRVESKGLKSLECEIYDRWGVKMFSWDGINGGWDGKVKSALAPEGTYYYIIKAEGLDTKQFVEKGYFQLLR